MATHAVFPAAGVGRRFGSDTPKQYANVLGQPVMAWTLQAFSHLEFIDQKIIAIHKHDEWADTVLAEFPEVIRVFGGDDRAASVLSALNELAMTAKLDDWVLVHDIARPCVDTNDVRRLIEACETRNEGGVLARQMTDTVKRYKAGQVSTLDRNELWTVQTPQCFRLGELIEALRFCDSQNLPVTDEASAMEAMGKSVHLIENASRNIKLTHSSDLSLIEFYLSQGNQT